MKPIHPRPSRKNGMGPDSECVCWPVQYIATVAGVDIYSDADTVCGPFPQLIIVWGDPAKDPGQGGGEAQTWTFTPADWPRGYDDWYCPPAKRARSTELLDFLTSYFQLTS